MKKNCIFSAVTVAVALVFAFAFTLYQKVNYSEDVISRNFQSKVVVIDAGHGGLDGGAVGTTGNVEKDINLSIALKLKKQLELNGVKCVLTRDTDTALNDKSAKTVKEIKKSDLHYRMDLVNSIDNSILVSIHQNHYETEKSHGMQVFYSPNDELSPLLAQSIQDTTVELIQKENTRQIKKATSDLFLLYKAKSPSVLVECGFMSNQEENRLLQTDEYQEKLAFAISLGIVQYLNVQSVVVSK